MKKHTVNLVWVWLIVLVIINVIPIGNEANHSLSSNEVFSFRLDYLLHSIMILVFAWIWVFGKMKSLRFFCRHERLSYSLLVLSAGIGLELLQLMVPWRSFNPVDMYYNLFGAALAVLLVNCCRG